MSLLEKQLSSLVCAPIHFVSLLTVVKSNVMLLLPDKDGLINSSFKKCVILLTLLLQKKAKKLQKTIFSTLVSHLSSKKMTFYARLNSLKTKSLNTLPIHLLVILVQELISKGKAYQPFWTPVYKALSEKLLSPTETGFLGSHSTSSTSSSPKQGGKSPSLTMTSTRLQNKSCQKTFYQLSTSSVVSKWESDPIAQKTVLKSLKIKMKLNSVQRKKFDEWTNTSNYVFNKAVELTSNGHKPNFYDLRTILVTENTKKNNTEYIDIENKIKALRKQKKDSPNKKIIDEEIKKCKDELKEVCRTLKSSKNENISNEWEFDTPKDIRDGAVNDVCKAYKTAFTNLKNGNIKRFKLNFRKKSSCSKSFVVPSTLIKIHTDENNKRSFRIAPNF